MEKAVAAVVGDAGQRHAAPGRAQVAAPADDAARGVVGGLFVEGELDELDRRRHAAAAEGHAHAVARDGDAGDAPRRRRRDERGTEDVEQCEKAERSQHK